MANTVTNFLIGIGLDTTEFDKGVKSVDSGIDNIRSSALKLAAVAAGAFGADQLTFGFAQANDQLGKFAQTFSVLPNDVAALGRALEHEGGSIESFMSQLAGIEQLRASTPQEMAGLFSAAGIVGIDPNVILQADSATDAYLALADVFDDLSGLQRLQAANLFGLDEASIRLLSKGRTEVDALVTSEQKLRPVNESMTTESARFNDTMQDFSTNIGGVADQISIKLLPVISSTVEGMNEWIGVNREFISSGINTFLDPMSDYITEIAVAGGLLVSGGLLAGLGGMAKFVPLIGGGLATAATAASRLTAVGAGATAAYVGGNIIDETLSGLIGPGYRDADKAFTQGIYNLFTSDPERDAGLMGTAETRRLSIHEIQNSQFNNAQKIPPINVTLKMDGNVIDQRIVDVNETLNETSVNDLTSTTRD
ncbi:MAG: hypothetical protein KAR42_11070 [candidate division Zixibacteria bacterium]|nr:hypothetical protein [candidate division Zixibacteria bacterium]